MPYLTTFEQKALEQGIEKGIRQGIVDALRQTLTVRFGDVPESLLESIQQIKSIEELQTLHKLALTVASLDELPV